jgi:tetratricopeptide (TPR) repeat protein
VATDGNHPADATTQDRERCESVIADLLAEAGATTDVATRADCLREAAAIYERQLGDQLRALLAWQAAFAEDPRSDEAGLAVERLAGALGQWSVVLPDCEALLPGTTDTSMRAALLVWLGRWSERYAHDESAAERFLGEAHQLAPASLDVADALSALHRKQGEWALAAEVCRRAGQATTDVEAGVGLLLEAARLVHTRVGDVESAMLLYRRVLELDPRNATAAEALAEAAGSGIEPAAICARYRQALEVDPDNVNIVRQWGEVAFTHGRWDDVRFLFQGLLDRVGGARPDNRARLNEALDRFVAAQKWPEAVDVLRTLARESTGSLAGKYFLAAGKIAQHELSDHQIALELYERAFDADPGEGKVGERIFDMLSSTRSWAEAEKSLRKLIVRMRAAGLANDPSVAISLWRRLGDVYRTGLKDMAQAAEAYKECARLAPQDRYAKMVAELTARSPVLAALDRGAV